MRVGIFTNLNKDKDLNITKSVIDSLSQKHQIDVFLHEQIFQLFDENYQSFNEYSNLTFDIMIAIGGDGTILRVAKYCAKTNSPIMGINLGRLGFLADIEPKDINNIADIIINKSFTLERRDLIEAVYMNKSYLALNEVVISRSDKGLVSLNVSVNGAFLDCFNSDGFIVATSVGSTAYSLSAGGPILSPFSEAFVLTPINSHSLYTRPIVINNKESVTIELIDFNTSADLIVDGVNVIKIAHNNLIKIQKAADSIKFIRLNDHNFYSKMFMKFIK